MKPSGQSVQTEGGDARGETVILRLFVADDEPNSKQARENLARLCQTHLTGRYEIEIVDVLEDFKTALENNVLVTPTLIVAAPRPPVRILGNLSDTGKVLAALRLT
jgi:circadian clock protein KaiB